MSDHYLDRVRAFHKKLYGDQAEPASLSNDRVVLARLRLMMEELGELASAMHEEDLVATADGLADLLYVVFGTALVLGIPIAEVYAEVHKANMSKDLATADTGQKYGSKTAKGRGYKAPNLEPILCRAGLL